MSNRFFSREQGWLDRTTPPHVVTLVILASMTALNMNIFLPSLKGMQEYFQTDYSVVQLTISAYLACTAILQIIIGPLSDRFGRRAVLLWTLTIFLVATVCCIFSPTIEILLFFRMIQAVVASGMVLSRAIVRDTSAPDEAASRIGYITMGMSVVPMVGPMIGGFLESSFGWQGSFVVVLIFGILATLLIWADLGETNVNKSASFGAQIRTYPELLKSHRFWGYSLTAAFASGVFFAFIGGASFVADEVLNLSPAELGMYFIFVPMGYMVGNFLTGKFSRRIGLNKMMGIGCLITTLAIVIGLGFIFADIVHPLTFFGSFTLVGLGNGLVLPNANAGIVSVKPHIAGSASGLGGAIMIGGGAVLSGLTGTMLIPETGVYALLFMMLGSSILSIVTSGYVLWAVRRATSIDAADLGS